MHERPNLKQYQNLPRFEDGRIDYSASSNAPVINCIVISDGKVLLLKRSNKVSNYKGKWNTIAGYLDKDCIIKDKALEEVKEEIGASKNDVIEAKVMDVFEIHDSDIGKTWIVYPVVIRLKHDFKIVLDWEHTEFAWVSLADLEKYDTVNQLSNLIRHALSGIQNL